VRSNDSFDSVNTQSHRAQQSVRRYLTLWRSSLSYGYSYKASRVRSSFVIFNIRALWRSRLRAERQSARCQKWWLNPVWHRMLYSCTHMATVGVKGLTNSLLHFTRPDTEAPDDKDPRWTSSKHLPHRQTSSRSTGVTSARLQSCEHNSVESLTDSMDSRHTRQQATDGLKSASRRNEIIFVTQPLTRDKKTNVTLASAQWSQQRELTTNEWTRRTLLLATNDLVT